MVVIGENSGLRDQLLVDIQGAHVQSQTLLPEFIPKNHSMLLSAYKIVWILSPTTSVSEIEQIGSLLKLAQERLVVVMPILHPFVVENSVGFEEFHKETQLQEQQIRACNKVLSDSFFIFGLELLGSRVGRSVIPHLVGVLSTRQLVFNPKLQIGVLSEEIFSRQIVTHMFRPGAKQSILVGAFEANTTTSLDEIANHYQSYHQKPVRIEVLATTQEKIIPFTVKKISVATSSEALSSFTRSLPSPQDEKNTPVVLAKSDEKTEGVSSSTPSVPNVTIATPVITSPNSPTLPQVKSDSLKVPSQESHSLEEILNTKRPTSRPFQAKSNKIELSQEDKTIQRSPAQTSNSTISKEDLTREVQQIFGAQRVEKKTSRIQSVAKKEGKQVKKSKRRTVLFYGGVFVFGVGLGILALIGLFFGSQWHLKNTLISVIEAQGQQREATSDEWVSVERATKIVAFQTESYGVLFDSELLSNSTTLLTFSNNLFATRDLHTRVESNAKQAFLGVFGGTTSNTGLLAENIATEARKTYENISQIQATLEQIELTSSTETQLAAIEEFEKQIVSLRKSLAVQQQFLPIVGWLSGEQGKKTYAVLLQNNQELRPTGGFIQAVALLTFQDGTLINSQVFSANDIDSRVAGLLTPPNDLTTHLGEKRWFFRDSNWDPDFPTTAATVAWFIDEALNVEIDGVVGLNNNSLASLIRAIGPIDIPEYNEVLTHQNLGELMEFHSEVVLVNQDRVEDYSTIVLKRVIQQLTSLPENKALPTMNALFSALEQHELLFTLVSDEYDSTLETLGWNGSLKHPECPPQLGNENCLVDMIAQIDTNIGVNKANYYVERTIVHDVFITKDVAQHSREIVIENTADSSAWPKGPYQAYIRFYASSNAQLDSLTINGISVADEVITQRDEHGFRLIGTTIEVPIQSEIILSLKYHVPITLEDASSFAYALFEQKQPGWQKSAVVTRISHDPSITPVLIAPQASVSGDQIIFDTSDNTHIFVGAQFAQ